MPKLNSLEVVHQDTNKDSYENLHDIIVGLKGSQNQEMVDAEARASYEALLEMYVNDKEAFARRIERLQAEFGTSLAQVVEEMLAYASASEAYAKRITAVAAEVSNAKASIMSESYARVTEDEALASQVNTVSATLGTKTTTYVQTTAPTGSLAVPLVAGDLWFDSDEGYKLYRYNGSTWVAVDDSRIAANTAAISNEQIARVNSDSALAIDINSVVARLDTGDFATVKTQASASVAKARVYPQTTAPTGGTYVVGDIWIDTDGDNKMYTWDGSSWVFSDASTTKTFSQTSAPTAINTGDLWLNTSDNNKLYRWNGSSWVLQADNRITSIEAKWGVTTDVNGYVAGIQLLNGGSTSSSFTVAANKFIVKKPDGTNGIAWNGTNSRLDISGDIYANTFYGNVVNTGNIIDNAVTKPNVTSIGTTSVNASETVYMSVVLTTTVASTVFASSSMGMSFPAGTNDSRFNLKINGNVVATMHTGSAYVQSIALSGALAVGAGTHTVQLTGWKSGAPTVEIESGTIYGVGIQK